MLNRIIRITATTLGTLFILAGCSRTSYDPAPEKGYPIIFDAGSALLRDDANTTKAATPLPAGTHFGVFAFLQPGTVGSPGTWNNNSCTPGFMFNQDVYYNGSTYTYAPVKYWPDTGNTISFWAYLPYTSNPGLLAKNGSAYTNTSIGAPDMPFSVTDGSVDLICSDLLTNKTKANDPIFFTFRHRLCKIYVNICKQDPTSGYTVKLKAIRFDGIYHSAAFRSSNASWVNLSNKSSFIVYADDPGDNTDDIELSTSNHSFDAVMLIPQTFAADGAKLHVEYSLSHSGILHERTNAFEVDLATVFSSASSKWDKNRQYTLTLTVVPDDPIEFTVSWSDWGDDFHYHITS